MQCVCVCVCVPFTSLSSRRWHARAACRPVYRDGPVARSIKPRLGPEDLSYVGRDQLLECGWNGHRVGGPPKYSARPRYMARGLLMPPGYSTEARIMAQRNVLATLPYGPDAHGLPPFDPPHPQEWVVKTYLGMRPGHGAWSHTAECALPRRARHPPSARRTNMRCVCRRHGGRDLPSGFQAEGRARTVLPFDLVADGPRPAGLRVQEWLEARGHGVTTSRVYVGDLLEAWRDCTQRPPIATVDDEYAKARDAALAKFATELSPGPHPVHHPHRAPSLGARL